MYYINSQSINSNHGNPQSLYFEGAVVLPDELLEEYITTMGFAILEVQEGIVTSIAINQEAYNAYQENHPAHTLTPAELREQEYEHRQCIAWGEEILTVDQANQQWFVYTAEGNVEIAQELTALIAEAKAQIREEIPDED